VANGKILRESPFRDVWIQPAAGDAGGAVGAALSAWYEYYGNPRFARDGDAMNGSFLGPRYSDEEIILDLDRMGAKYRRLDDNELMPVLARLLAEENVIGLFQGRMEFGPRALGARSIIGDSRSPKMQALINLKIKYRESFRPFAPAVMADKVGQYFELDRPSPYMLLVAGVREELRIPMTSEQQQLFGIEKLNVPRSSIPAVSHVDYSARVQTVHRETNPRFYSLLEHFCALTGCAVVVNTSFNVRGEPIVCSPADAYRCFIRTEMDYLVLENFLLAKSEQPSKGNHDQSWMKEYDQD
jgi:carbamoyltransferase